MNPSSYASAFRNLRVFVEGASADDDAPTPMALEEKGTTPPVLLRKPRLEVMDVNAYLLVTGVAPKHDYFGKFGSVLKRSLYVQAKVVRVDGAVEDLSVPYSDIAYGLIAPFWGKGYPEECQLALQLWTRLGLKPEAKQLLDSSAYDGAIGLDCNGFVGGFLERNRHPAQWLRKKGSLTSALINTLMGLDGANLTSLDDFNPPENALMIMGLADPTTGRIKDHSEWPPGHIVITDPGSVIKQADGTVTATVSESTGIVGITTSTYTIKSFTKASDGSAVFKVHRGCKEKLDPANVTGYFKIRRLA